MNDALLRLLLLCVAAITAVSGLVQWVIPASVLGLFTASEPLSAHLFRTVGMFMLITGAMFAQSLWHRSTEPAIPLWIGAQKLFAAWLVTQAVIVGLFAPLALGVAGFDLLSGILALVFWYRQSSP